MSMSKDCSKCGTPNSADARFCGRCGAALEAERAGGWYASPGRWVALGGASVVLVVCGAWWLNAPRPVATPSFDAAPPPSMSTASNPATAARKPPDQTARSTPPTAATAVSAATRPPASDLWEPVDRPAATDDAGAAEARQAARLKTERAARERGFPAATRTRNSAPATTPARSVRERCVNLNIIAKALCESRECMRGEHAGEAVCQRIRAADDRRREQ